MVVLAFVRFLVLMFVLSIYWFVCGLCFGGLFELRACVPCGFGILPKFRFWCGFGWVWWILFVAFVALWFCCLMVLGCLLWLVVL